VSEKKLRATADEQAKAMVWSVGQAQAVRSALVGSFPTDGPGRAFALACLVKLMKAEVAG
jgi:hypothetical protein